MDRKPFEGVPRAAVEKMLREWEKACDDLRAVRRETKIRFRFPTMLEARLDRRVARIERLIIRWLYRETFGYRSGRPNKAQPYSPRPKR